MIGGFVPNKHQLAVYFLVIKCLPLSWVALRGDTFLKPCDSQLSVDSYNLMYYFESLHKKSCSCGLIPEGICSAKS
jgi:hypothetical protein